MSQAQVVPADDDYQDKIDRCSGNVIAFIKGDVTIRVPRTEAKRQNVFSEWLAECFDKYRPVIQSELKQEFGFQEHKSTDTDEKAFEAQVEQDVWKQVAPFLQAYAVFGQAASWISHHMGDATTMHWPEREGDYWRVRLGVAKYGDNLGEIVLDENGTVIPERTSTHEQILERIRDRKRPVAETTLRK